MQLSFVIISYNERQYLAHAIESCLQQPVAESEIIIADDGSNDGSVELIREYAAKYPDKIRYFVNDRADVIPGKVVPSFRVSNNIKKALSMARGRYCQLLSGDDFFYPGSFSQDAVAFLDEHPDYSSYVGRYAMYWNDQSGFVNKHFVFKPLCWFNAYVHISAFVFRKSIFDQGKFLDRFCDDTGLYYTLAIAGKWHQTDDLVMGYRQRDGSIMHTADRLELNILELMLLQDVCRDKKLYFQSLSRFKGPLIYAFKNRAKLSEPRYTKYLDSCAQYPNDILADYLHYDELRALEKCKIWARMICAVGVRYIFFPVFTAVRVVRELYKIATGN